MRLIRSIAPYLAILLFMLAIPLFFLSDEGGKAPGQEEHLPWNIETLPGGGSRVFGLILGESPLADAYRTLGDDAQVALLVAPGESGTVEAYYDSLAVGFITGEMILTLETSQAQREAMLARAIKAETTQNAARRITLADTDLQQLRSARIVGITFIPTANLSEEIVLQRFGMPAEKIRSDDNAMHWLYPDRGLEVRIDVKGKEVLQYVAPRDFARLRDPLLAAGR